MDKKRILPNVCTNCEQKSWGSKGKCYDILKIFDYFLLIAGKCDILRTELRPEFDGPNVAIDSYRK